MVAEFLKVFQPLFIALIVVGCVMVITSILAMCGSCCSVNCMLITVSGQGREAQRKGEDWEGRGARWGGGERQRVKSKVWREGVKGSKAVGGLGRGTRQDNLGMDEGRE